MSPELRAMFKKYNDDPEMSHYGFDTYEEALESLHQNPSHFIFANTMLAAHHFSLRRDRDLDIYAYKNGFKLSSHIPVGKGNPFKRILNAGMKHFKNKNNRTNCKIAGILRMSEKGVMDLLLKRYLSSIPKRSATFESETLTLGQMISSFYIYFLVLIIVTAILMCEIFQGKYGRK